MALRTHRTQGGRYYRTVTAVVNFTSLYISQNFTTSKKMFNMGQIPSHQETVPVKLYLCRFIAFMQRFSFLSSCRKFALSFVCFSLYVKAVRSSESHKSPAFMFLSVILCHFLSNKRWEMFICVLYLSYTYHVCL